MDEIIDTRYQKIRRNKEELVKHMNTFNLEMKPSSYLPFFLLFLIKTLKIYY